MCKTLMSCLYRKNEQGQLKASFLLIAGLLGDKGVREYAESARIIKAKSGSLLHLVGWIDDNPSAISTSRTRYLDCRWSPKRSGKLSDAAAIAESSVFVLPLVP